MVATNNGTAYVGLYTNNFIYDGWNLAAILNPANTILESFMWGSDLGGSMQSAGGVGGLLEVSYHGTGTTNCFPAYDGNGNIMALINASDGAIIANYEYGPFGEVIRQTGPMAKVNPFRFSSKYEDDESDLLYYGYRYYKPSTGTWVNRDSIEEQGGINLYCFAVNDSTGWVDTDGHFVWPGPTWPPEPPWPPNPPPQSPPYTPLRPYNPPDANEPCCCCTDGPAKLSDLRRTDPPPRRFYIQMSVSYSITGCYKDVDIAWWTCARIGGAGGLDSDPGNPTSAGIYAWGGWGNSFPYGNDGPHLTITAIRFLSCEDGTWKIHDYRISRAYTWENGQWVASGDTIQQHE